MRHQIGQHGFLLFYTICSITSGQFTSSPVTDHHHHHHHHHHYHQQQQQQQQRYHLSPTGSAFIPAIHPRSHLLSKRHIIVRRAILPNDHHHQLSPHSIAPSITTIKRTNRLQIEEELKALKRKRKRLRQLREEVRKLSNHLQSKRVYLKDDISGGDLLKKHKIKEAHFRWRKQITTRVKTIMKRLKRLENEVKTERNFTKEKKKITKRLPVSAGVNHMVSTTPLPRTYLITTTNNLKIKRLHSSINQSKSGESGGICSGHKDCKPGLCCHRIASSIINSSVTNVCHQHLLKDGESCEDTCQCEARLHCFRSSNVAKNGNSANKMKRDTMHAICKKVSTEDIVNGIYLNSKDSTFPTKPSAP